MPFAKSFRELEVYRFAQTLSQQILTLSYAFPKEERFALTDQIRRSSRSVGAQIAEAWAKRRYEKHFVSKLTDADGEANETQHWIETSGNCNYITSELHDDLLKKYDHLSRMINSMINKSDDFCD